MSDQFFTDFAHIRKCADISYAHSKRSGKYYRGKVLLNLENGKIVDDTTQLLFNAVKELARKHDIKLHYCYRGPRSHQRTNSKSRTRKADAWGVAIYVK